jgi:hypothetical protein
MEIYVVALSWNRGVQEVTEWMSKVFSSASLSTQFVPLEPKLIFVYSSDVEI